MKFSVAVGPIAVITNTIALLSEQDTSSEAYRQRLVNFLIYIEFLLRRLLRKLLILTIILFIKDILIKSFLSLQLFSPNACILIQLSAPWFKLKGVTFFISFKFLDNKSYRPTNC